MFKTFAEIAPQYHFEWVGDQREYYYKGDIKAIAADGREIFIEVKNDSRIADTQNVLCEEEVFYKETGTFKKGNMFCDSDIFAIVSE